jgi:hypothetical protein
MDLQNAVQWLAQAAIKEPKAAALQEEYVRTSQEWEAGEIQRLKELNEEKERQARIATARVRVSYALGSLDEDPERSLLLAMHAVAATWSHDRTVPPDTEELVHRSLLESQVRLTLKDHLGNVTSVAWSPDGQRLATRSQDKTAKVWAWARCGI